MSAGVCRDLNHESSPPSLLKAFSLMILRRWEKVAVQEGVECRGEIDPGNPPSFLLPPLSLYPFFILSCFLFISSFFLRLTAFNSPFSPCTLTSPPSPAPLKRWSDGGQLCAGTAGSAVSHSHRFPIVWIIWYKRKISCDLQPFKVTEIL